MSKSWISILPLRVKEVVDRLTVNGVYASRACEILLNEVRKVKCFLPRKPVRIEK